MSDLHLLGVAAVSKEHLERVDARFLREGLLCARDRSWQVYREIIPLLRAGMTEDEARKLVLDLFQKHGVKKHWHRPYVRFGPGTVLTFNDPIQPDYRLKDGDPVYIDLGPVWSDVEHGIEYEGDVGDSFSFGTNAAADRCASVARGLFEEARKAWREAGLSGREIYALLSRRAQELGYVLIQDAQGHRIGDFPHQKFSKTALGQVEFTPVRDLWILEVMITTPDRSLGAFFEDTL